MNVHVEVFLAAGYAIFLVGVALGLDFLARHSHVRSERYRNAGFTYHPNHDAWICPEDQILTRQGTDHERRLVRYRGRPQICNHCPSKRECTDSNEGREISRALDPWPHSEAGRFHRGISLAVASIAGPLLAVEAARNHAPWNSPCSRPRSRWSRWRPGACTRPSATHWPTSLARLRPPEYPGSSRTRATEKPRGRGAERPRGSRRRQRVAPTRDGPVASLRGGAY